MCGANLDLRNPRCPGFVYSTLNNVAKNPTLIPDIRKKLNLGGNELSYLLETDPEVLARKYITCGSVALFAASNPIQRKIITDS